MFTLCISMVAAVLVLGVAGVAVAKKLLPDSEWNEETKTLLAQAMVAEADWLAKTDHAAIAYTLKRLWESGVREHGTYHFVDALRKFVSGFRALLPGQIRERLTWIRALRMGQTEAPEGWQTNARWEKHKRLWENVLQFAEDWRGGLIPDPCHGRSLLWRGVGDPRPDNYFEKVDCGETANTFFGRIRRNEDVRDSENTKDSPRRSAGYNRAYRAKKNHRGELRARAD